MDILLIDPPLIRSEKNIWKKVSSCMPSLGLAYMASYLERNEIGVKILDCQAERISLEKISGNFKKFASPKLIGITTTTLTIQNAMEIAEICKRVFPSSKVVMGGVHPTILPNEVLNNKCVDFVVRGEGEITMTELAKGKSLETIQGLSYKQEGVVVHNKERPLIGNLDAMPYPAYHLLPMSKYFPAVGSYKRLPAMSMITTRGCPFRCTFCYKTFGGKVRRRSAQNIVNEIKLLVNDYGIKEIVFYDDVFTLFKERVKELCSIIIEENIDITWACFARADCIDSEMLSLMKKAGCHQVMYGIESVDEQILKNINKKMSLEKVKNAVYLTKRVGISARGAFMLGNPGETEETMEKTIDFATKLDLDLAIFNITTPYPGTEMFNWAKGRGYLITEDWSKYDLSDVVMNLPSIDCILIKQYYKLAYRRFYLRPKYLLKRLLCIRTKSELRESVDAILSVLTFIAEKSPSEREGMIRNRG